MKKENLIITIVFLCSLFLPNVIYFFIKDKMDNNNYENRNLYTKPSFEYGNIATFPKNYENYYNDHLAFKNEIRTLRSKVLYNLFKTSSNGNVIIGKNNWLFYNGAFSLDGNPISDYQNITRYSNNELEKIKQNLISNRDKLKNQGIDMYIFVIPNKENVYADYMPKIINRESNDKSKTEVLLDYLNKQSDLEIIYPKNELINNRKNYDTYLKNDTHWNSFGAYVGVAKLVNRIDPNINVGKIEVSDLESTGDLAQMLLMPNDLMSNNVITTNFMTDINVSCSDEVETFMVCNSSSSNAKTILFVGDSFRLSAIQYLSKLYQQSYFIHRDSYNQELIAKYNPDIIVFELVERYSYVLADVILTN